MTGSSHYLDSIHDPYFVCDPDSVRDLNSVYDQDSVHDPYSVHDPDSVRDLDSVHDPDSVHDSICLKPRLHRPGVAGGVQ